jgi:uncharacterized membrane protein YvbJ
MVIMRICKKCGAQFPDDHNFCSSCGERYIEYTSSPAYQTQIPRSTSNTFSAETFLKFLPLGVSILGFIVAWQSDWIFGLIACVGATVYSYSRYNNSKSDFNKISLIVSAGAAILIILLKTFL